MPKDYAARGPTHTPTSKPRKKKNQSRKKSNRVLFHGPSFSSGAIVGGAIVVLAAYAPELLGPDLPLIKERGTEEITKPVVEFEFPKLLRENEVVADPSAYEVPKPKPGAAEAFYTIQAASFRNGADAETLRADLLLNDLPAQIDTRLVSDKVWFRVTVGPFPRKVEANRAMSKLREMRLIPIWLNNHNG